MKKLILFDLDGVLLDSRTNMEHAWAAVRKKTGITVPFENYFALIGRPFRDILDRIGLKENQAAIEQAYMAASLYFLSNASFYEGTKEALQELAAGGRKLGIVTSKDAVRTKAVIEQLGVEFSTIQCPTKPFRGKPAPDHLLLAMAESGEDPADTVYIGDMDTDYRAAVRAGIDYIHASWGYGQPIAGVPALSSIQELPKHLS
ncbi:MAG TPA: HAD-IA family hydrolase [Luteolibacter sp.]|jgi:phosphoglycolate phosphatase|nr:HAD-IA family hydrolase [Luteolibacter sp.]